MQIPTEMFTNCETGKIELRDPYYYLIIYSDSVLNYRYHVGDYGISCIRFVDIKWKLLHIGPLLHIILLSLETFISPQW